MIGKGNVDGVGFTMEELFGESEVAENEAMVDMDEDRGIGRLSIMFGMRILLLTIVSLWIPPWSMVNMYCPFVKS